LPESFWYSKVACILRLEVSNERIVVLPDLNVTPEGGSAPLHPPVYSSKNPVFVTDISPNSFNSLALAEGKVGRRELGDGSKHGNDVVAPRDEHHRNTPQPAGREAASPLPASSPRTETLRGSVSWLARQKQIPRAKSVSELDEQRRMLLTQAEDIQRKYPSRGKQ